MKGLLLALILLTGCAQARPAASSAEVALGAKLFMDRRLSADGSLSCASCHDPGRAFTDGRRVALGIKGARGTRNTPTLYGLKGLERLFWDGRARSLEEQVLGPLTHPAEMGASAGQVDAYLASEVGYQARFKEAYGEKPSLAGLQRAIAGFERALTLEPSSYDRWRNGEPKALSASAQRGYAVFNQKANCVACHRGLELTDGQFHRLGLESADEGRFAVTRFAADRGAFKTPTLRNVAKTAPYMHDGSIESLEEVVELYDRGGGSQARSPLLKPLGLTAQEKADLVEFLKNLNARDNAQELLTGN